MSFKRTAVAVAILTQLSACGGTTVPTEIVATPDPEQTTPPANPTPPMTPPPSRIDIANAAFTTGNTIRGDNPDLLSLAEMRTVGAATYKGPYLLISRSGVDGFIGDGTLNISFGGDSSVSGTVTNFVHSDRGMNNTLSVDIPSDAVLTQVPGQLDFTRSSVGEGGGIGFSTINISGTLTLPANLNPTSADRAVGVAGAVTTLFTDTQLAARNGLFFRPEGTNSLAVYDSLFVGDKQN